MTNVKKKSVFDKILKKDNYTKDEVKEILLGTYQGFTDGWLKKHPESLLNAKQEVFDDKSYKLLRSAIKRFAIEKNLREVLNNYLNQLEKHHLSTFVKTKEI